MTTVLVADDQELVRLGLRTLIDSEDDLTFAGEAADGLSAVAETRRLQPDVVLMDIRMPGIDGLEATRRITTDTDLADVRIIVLTTFELDEYVFDALRHGASGFLLKDTNPAELVQAIRLVAVGGALLSPAVTRTVVRVRLPFTAATYPTSVAGHPDRPRTGDRRAGRRGPQQRGDR